MTFQDLMCLTLVAVIILSIVFLVIIEDWLNALIIDFAIAICCGCILIGISMLCEQYSFNKEILVSTSPIVVISETNESLQYLNLQDGKYYSESMYQITSDQITTRNLYEVYIYKGFPELNNGVKRIENVVRFE